MNDHERDTMPSTVMWWGIAVLLAGALLIVLVPVGMAWLMNPSSPGWQSAYLLFDTVLSVLRVTLPPLGAALIAASLVMRYLDRRLGLVGTLDRPKRWVFPRTGG